MAQTDKNLERDDSDEASEIIRYVFDSDKYPDGFKEKMASFIRSAIKHEIDTVVLVESLEITRNRCNELGGWWDSRRFIAYSFAVLKNLIKDYVKI